MTASKGKWVPAKHLIFLNRKLLDIAAGRIKRLFVSMPPRHGKSELISKYFTAWYLGSFPDHRVILTSYEADFASQWGRKSRDILEEWGHLFGIELRHDSNAANRWEIKGREGGMQTAGAGGPITGKGANLFIIDDPVKNSEDADSERMREKMWDWYRSTAYTRLEPDAAMLGVMTRWHDDDLAGRILELEGDDWEFINLPALAADDDPLGRAEGEALWPERYPREELERIQRTVGSRVWNALYQGLPVPEGGEIMRSEWWHEYDHTVSPDIVVQSWDTAFKSGQDNDYSVCTTWGIAGNDYYLLDLWRGRVEYPELRRVALQLYEKWRPSKVLIEDKASGQSLIQELKKGTPMPLIAVKVDKDKVTRAHAATPLIESGRVLIPKHAPWAATLVKECADFPHGKHDDIVDSVTQFLNHQRGAKMPNVRWL
jgi:predicted phage terminase large subunit-like protein